MADGTFSGFYTALKNLFAYFFNKSTERQTALEIAKFTAYKTLLFFLLCMVLPTVLYNLYFVILFGLIDAASSYASANALDSFLLKFTGLAAWCADKCRFVEAFGIFMDALTIRFVFRVLRIV